MSDLLRHFKSRAAAAVTTINHSVATLGKAVLIVLCVADCFRFALIEGAAKSCSVKHGLLDWMQLLNVFGRFLAALTIGKFDVALAWSTD